LQTFGCQSCTGPSPPFPPPQQIFEVVGKVEADGSLSQVRGSRWGGGAGGGSPRRSPLSPSRAPLSPSRTPMSPSRAPMSPSRAQVSPLKILDASSSQVDSRRSPTARIRGAAGFESPQQRPTAMSPLGSPRQSPRLSPRRVDARDKSPAVRLSSAIDLDYLTTRAGSGGWTVHDTEDEDRHVFD